jgi:DNA-binding transcriptional LysR family regulator
MDLRQLEAFAAVMSVGSITGAGQMLGRSQPAVTRLIRDLETELGLPLFERNGPKVTPTAQAFVLANQVEQVLAGARQVRLSADRLVNEEDQDLRLVATPALAAGLVPAALARLPDAFRPRRVNLRSQLAEGVVQSVLTNTVDIGVVSLPLEHRGVDVHWIGEAPCVAVVAATSALAAETSLSREALAGQPLITLANPYRLRRRIDQALAGGPAPEILETNASLIATQMARAGLGVALVDPITALGSPLEGTVVLPIAIDVPFFFGVITPYARPLSSAARLLIGALEDTARAVAPGFVRHEMGAHDALLRRINATHD